MYTFLVWFSDAQTIYYATFLKTKGKGYGDISIAIVPGGGWSCRPVAGKYRGGEERENEIALCEIFNKPRK